MLVKGVPAMPASTINLDTTIDLDAPLERVWPLLSDTDRVNRLVGLPAFERAEPDRDLTQMVRSHYLGIPVAWRENPFEWVFEQWFQVERAFAEPLPIDRLLTGARLTRLDGDRTRVEIWVRLTPRNIIGWLGARLYIGRKLLGDLLRVYRSLGELAANAAMVVPPPSRRPMINAGRVARATERLQIEFRVAPALVERLTMHLSMADDPDVVRMRPFALADAWGEPRLDVLRTFLYATRVGLLDLEWDVICPNCRGATVRAATLADLVDGAHCTSCNIRYDVNFDEAVELRFSVNPDIREAVDMPYCIGGPANTRHIMSQLWLPPHSAKELRLHLAEGAYRLRSRQLPAVAALSVAAGEHTARVSFGDDTLTADTTALASGEVTLELENTTDTSLLVVLEQSAWSAQAASAALVTALAEFRQLFSSEVLAPGLGVSVRNLTFMFSDLKDSTMIYDTIGDSPAYARVRDHFGVMNEIIARWRGALVKTIGDAVMAVFPMVDDAMQASLEIQREFTAGEIARGNPALKVKLGLHRGPCIAVNANGLLDYFGSTVNIAARVQSASVGGDIVVTPEVLHDPEVAQVLEHADPTIETFERELKGFSQSFTLYRLWVSAEHGTAQQAEKVEEQVV
jgi:class 3 adenylate cyclase